MKLAQTLSENRQDRACAECPAFSICPFRGLAPEALARVDIVKRPGSASPEQTVASAGDRLAGPLCVGKGVLRAEFTGPSGKRHLLRFFGPGDLVGMVDGFGTQPLPYDLVADTPARFCIFPGPELTRLSSDCKPLCDEMMRRMSDEAKASVNRTKLLMEKRADQRIAAALIEFDRLKRDFNRRELAEWAGTTVENVIRTLAKFAEDGLIRKEREKLEFLDRRTLEEMAAL